MTSKLKDMLSRVSAQSLKPTLALLAALSLAIIPTSAVCADWITWDAGGGDDTAFTTDANWTGDVFPGTLNIAELRDGADGKTISFTSPGTQVGGVYVRNNWWNVTPSPVVFTASDNSYGFESLGGFGAGDIGNCLAAFTIEKGTYTAVDGYWGWGSGASLTATLNGGTLTYTGQYGLNIGWGDSGKVTATINVAGGTIATTGGSIKMGSVHTAESEVKMNVSNGGVVQCGSTTSEQWLSIGDNDGALGTISVNLNASGTLKAWHIANYSNGSGKDTLAFDGGTLEALGAGTDPLISSGVAVDVKSGGAIFNVGANALTVAAPVSGTGTITVKGTGSLTFTGDMSGFCGAVVVETSGCTVTLPASATKAVPGANTSASNGVYSYSAYTTHHDWWTGDSSTDWATAGNWGRFLIDEGTTGYDINEWNDNTINFASVVNISKPLTITENDPDNSYNVEFTASSASDGLVSTDVLNVGTSNEGMATFTSGTYSFNNMYVGGSGATGSVTVNGASLTITTGDPQIGNGGTGTFTLSSGFVSFGYAGSAKWAFLKGGTINLDGGEMAVCRLNCDTAPAVINFNGGTLTSYNDGYSKDNIIEDDANWTLNVKAGGAKFNIPSGLTTTVNQVLSGDAESTGGGLTKLGGGALVLLAEPTFTGVITVFGGSVKLPAGATVAAGENTVKYESADGVYFYPKYTWCGSANDGAWTNPANWLVGEVAAVGYPSAEGEVAVIATAATIYSDVAISVSEIQTDAAVTFAGKLTSSSLVKSGTGTLTLVGVTSPTTDFAITAGSVVINNSLDGITPYVQLDASNESTVTVTGDYVTKWTSSVAENDTTHYYENADSTMTLTTDYFGGKRAVRTNGSNLKADFSNKLGVRSVFAVLYGISYPNGMRLYYKTGANNVYIGKRNSGNNYWSCLIASSTTPASPYLWQNGALDALWSTTAAGSVFTVKKFVNNFTSADYLGGTGDIAIGELIGLSAAEPSASDSKRIEAYLGNKWKISGMQTFATSIPLTLSAGTTLNLGSLSRTVASLTGSGTVQNGKLNVTAAISVGAGETLVIPYGSTYTTAEGTVADVDETNGTVTFTKAPASITISAATTYYSTVQAAVDAAAANAEGEGKTVTLECNVTEDVSIPGIGITIVAGSYAITGTVTGASGIAVNYDEGTHTYTSVEASGWVWTGAYEGNNNWSDGRNWNYNGVAQEEGAIPGSSDTVTFESNASVTLTANQAVANVVLASDVVLTLSGNNAAFGLIGLVSLGSADVAGDKIVLNGVKLTSADLALNDGELNWYADLDVAGSPSTNFIYSTSSDGSNGRAIKIHGNLTGTGNIRLACNSGRSGTSFYGKNGGFSGVCIIDQDKGPRGPFTFCSADSGSASARWVYTGGANKHQDARVGAIGATKSTIHFGSYEGNIYIMGCRSVSGDTISIGGLNTDFRCSLSASSSAAADRANNNATLKKVGTGTMTFGNGAGNPCFNNYELNNGVLKFDNNGILRSATGQSSYAYPTFSFTGGTIAYGANCVDSGDNILDISGQLGNSTAPLKVLLEAGQTSTWGTALTTVNAPQGLVKQGAGTLVLGAVPTYTAATVIEAGTLVVPGADVTIASLSISEGAQLAVDISQMADEASVTVTVTSGTALTADNFTFTGATGARTANIVIAEGGMSATLTAKQANYVWTNNAVSDSNWSTLGNWNVGSAVATSLPTSGDVVEFPANAEVNVDIEGVAVQELILNGVATFSGNVIAIGTLTGDYEITLGNGGGFSIAANKTLANDFAITAATETPAVLTTSLNGVGFTLDGTLSGTGCLTLSGTSNTHQLHGDNSYFGGTINITGMSGQLVDHTSSVDYTSGTSADATWNVTFSGNNFLGNNVENDFPEYQFGKLTGTINESNASSHHTVVYVVGGALPANETMALAYTGINNASRANSFRMVGEGIFEIDGSYVRSYEVNAGTVKFMSNTSIPNYFIYFNGGTLALTSAVTSDPSGKFAFADAKTAILDDGGENRTFATAIGNDANGNATSANFTKKGTGTLTLSQPPAYTGATTVEAGLLVMPASAEATLTLGANTIVSARDANTITLANATTVNITNLTQDHATATVTAGSETVTVTEEGVAAVPVGSNVVITWTAEAGYQITAGGMQVITNIREAKEADEPTVSVLPAVSVTGVSATYGVDFTNATVTATLTGATAGQSYTMTVGGKSYNGEATTDGKVTFNDVAVTHSQAYDTFTYEITSNDASVSAGAGSKTIADEAAWFSTGANGSTEQTSGGSWEKAMTWTDGKTTFDEDGNTFTATDASSASKVEVKMSVCFGNANDEAIDLVNANAAVKVATEGNALVFQALNNEEFVTLNGLTPTAEATYEVVLCFDYTTHKYTVTIGDTPLTYNESTELVMSSESTGIQSVAFKGVGSLASLAGTQTEGCVAMDAAGTRYLTLEAAMEAAANGSAKLPLTVLHDGTYNGATYAKGATGVPSGAAGVTISAADQTTADAAAAKMSIALTSAQVQQGLKTAYYKAVAKEKTSGTYEVSFELADAVKPTVADEESTKAMETTTSAVALHVTNTKVGLYYGIAAGTSTNLGIDDAATLTKCTADGQDLGLTATLPESGVKYYKVIVSDSAPSSN